MLQEDALLGVLYRERQINQYIHGNRSVSSPDLTSSNCQLSSVASYHGLAMSADMTCCRKTIQQGTVEGCPRKG